MYVCSDPHVRPSLSLNPELMDSANLASRFAPGNQFLLPECWVIGGCHDCLAFVWILGVQTWVLILGWKVLYLLSHLPSLYIHF